MGNRSSKLAGLASAFGAVALSSVASPAGAVDWSAVQGKAVTLFHPGQASWEWVLTRADHSGAPKLREGKTCASCHEGEEKDIGAVTVSGKKLEPEKLGNRRGSFPAEIKFAHDGDKLYVRIEWPDAPSAGGEKGDPEFPVKVAMMIDDGKVNEATLAGCWATCHDDAAGMASAAGKKMTKYLGRSRPSLARTGGGETPKPQADIDAMMNDGQFMEYWQAKMKPGAPAAGVAGSILAKRDESKAPAVTVEGKLEGGKWVAILSRKLQAAGPGQKAIAPGKTYAVGFAVHDDYAAGRLHSVSVGYTLALDGGKADFVAMKK